MPWQAVDTIPFGIGAEISPMRASAIREALLRRAVPLARLLDGRLEPLATASIVIDGPARAVLTAAHVFEQAGIDDLVIPLPREHRLLLLRSTRVRVVTHARLDIAMLWLIDRAVSDRVCANWTACPLRQWCGSVEVPSALYAMAGYPAVNARRSEGCLYVKPMVMFTAALDAGRYAYARTALRSDGLEISTPELDGVSGATVWAVEDRGQGGVDCVLRPSAIQVAFQHGRHVRGEPIRGVVDLLARAH